MEVGGSRGLDFMLSISNFLVRQIKLRYIEATALT